MTILEIKKEVELTKQEISQIKYVDDDPDRYNELYNKLNKLMTIYSIVSKPMIAYSDELDIYEEKKGLNTYVYHLMLHNDVKQVGYIRITYDDGLSMYGNIGYEIKLPYRGNDFTLKALEMLESTMIEKGLTNPIITARKNNIASNRVIEKFGGELIDNKSDGLTYNSYQVDLLKKKHQEFKQKIKHL